LKVQDVTFADVDRLHRSITRKGSPYAANRAVALLSKMFSLAVRWGMRSGDNPAKGVERNIEYTRRRYLSSEELVRLTSALAGYPDKQIADIVRLLLLTGARRGEVLAMRWADIDLTAGLWSKPPSSTYVAARAPDADEDYTALANRFPTPPASAGIVWSGDYGRLSEEAFLRDFAGDVPADKARVLYAVQAPFKRALLADKTTHAAWRSKLSWYAVSTEDRTINPDLQRFMAKRMGAKTIEVKASHVSLISQPDTITNLILEAAGQK
jgi:integrase